MSNEKHNIETKSKFQIHFYGFLLSSTGWFYGYGISFYNTFGNVFLKYVYNIEDEKDQNNRLGDFLLMLNLGGLVCCLTFSYTYEKYGRYKVFVILQFLNIFCVLMQLIKSMIVLYIFRFMYGYLLCSYGFISLVMIKENLPNFASKIWSPMFYTFITIGYLTCFAFYSRTHAENWRFVYALPIVQDVPRVILMLIIYRMESPDWIYDKYKKQDNIQEKLSKNYKYIYTDNYSQHKAQEFVEEQKQYQNTNNKQEKASLFSKYYFKQFLIVLYINIMTQMTGATYLNLYSTTIFEELGMDNSYLLTLIMGVVTFLSACMSIIFLRVLDLRDLLIYGMVTQAIALVLLIFSYKLTLPFLVLGSIYLYLFGFVISLGNAVFSYQVLILPPRGITIASTMQWLIAALNSKFALNIINAIGIFIVFLIFAIISVIGAIINVGYLIEVEGKSKKQIRKQFMDKKFMQRNKKKNKDDENKEDNNQLTKNSYNLMGNVRIYFQQPKKILQTNFQQSQENSIFKK